MPEGEATDASAGLQDIGEDAGPAPMRAAAAEVMPWRARLDKTVRPGTTLPHCGAPLQQRTPKVEHSVSGWIVPAGFLLFVSICLFLMPCRHFNQLSHVFRRKLAKCRIRCLESRRSGVFKTPSDILVIVFDIQGRVDDFSSVL